MFNDKKNEANNIEVNIKLVDHLYNPLHFTVFINMKKKIIHFLESQPQNVMDNLKEILKKI